MAHFWPILPILGAKKIFLKNLTLSHTTSYGFLAPCQNLEKANDTIQRKHLDRRKDKLTEEWKDRHKDERMDGQTLFYRTLPANTGGPIKAYSYREILKSDCKCHTLHIIT